MANPTPSSMLRILLVEDSESDAILLRHHLEHAGILFTLRQVTSGSAALAALALEPVDVLLTDYRLPGEDGLALIQRVHRVDPDLACILVSGQVGEEIAVAALHAGARDFILKGNLSRLVPAMLREQSETANRRQKRILEREKTQQAQFLQTLLDTLPSPVFYKDAAGKFEGCNRAFENTFGIQRSELKGKTVFDILPKATAERLHSKDMRLFSQAGVQFHQSQVRFADGAIHEVLFYQATYAEGEARGLVGSLLDISALTKMRGALRQCRDRYHRILQVAREGVFTTDRQFHLTFVNESFESMMEASTAQLLHAPLASFIRAEDLEDHALRLDTQREGKSENFERILVLPNGSQRFVMISATPIMAEDGEFDGIFAMITDLTEQKRSETERLQMETQLRHAQKLEAIGQLAAGIAHEINTPTQYIGDNAVFLRDSFVNVLGFLNGLQDRVNLAASLDCENLKSELRALDLDYLKEEIPRALQQSLEGVSRVSKIVSAMKDFSHPGGAGRERVDLNRAIESTITVSRNEWKYVATLETDFDPTLPPVPCYPSEFNQVVLNLLVNAAHAIAEANGGKDAGPMGLIRVSTHNLVNAVEIRISDSGTGIPKQIQSRIFDPFFTTKAVGKGTGQGLSIARAVIVDKHGGTIEVCSEPGQGALFIIQLPLGEFP